ncbi:hypothetical protein B0H11DRAFT_1940403 [Mycena galericulata]|nr:hypothetical protein B0H11DRAFT_1940403 [Mycena galericulata]
MAPMYGEPSPFPLSQAAISTFDQPKPVRANVERCRFDGLENVSERNVPRPGRELWDILQMLAKAVRTVRYYGIHLHAPDTMRADVERRLFRIRDLADGDVTEARGQFFHRRERESAGFFRDINRRRTVAQYLSSLSKCFQFHEFEGICTPARASTPGLIVSLVWFMFFKGGAIVKGASERRDRHGDRHRAIFDLCAFHRAHKMRFWRLPGGCSRRAIIVPKKCGRAEHCSIQYPQSVGKSVVARSGVPDAPLLLFPKSAAEQNVVQYIPQSIAKSVVARSGVPDAPLLFPKSAAEQNIVQSNPQSIAKSVVSRSGVPDAPLLLFQKSAKGSREKARLTGAIACGAKASENKGKSENGDDVLSRNRNKLIITSRGPGCYGRPQTKIVENRPAPPFVSIVLASTAARDKGPHRRRPHSPLCPPARTVLLPQFPAYFAPTATLARPVAPVPDRFQRLPKAMQLAITTLLEGGWVHLVIPYTVSLLVFSL